MSKRQGHGRSRLSLPVMLLFLGAACGGGGGNNVGTTLSNFKIALDKGSAKTGEVTFKIKNDGPSIHEFVILKTDLAPDALPTKDENGVTIVDEEGQGIEPVDEKEDIPSGSSTSLTATLAPGKYVLICNISEDGGHYAQGMRTGFTVTP